MKYLHLYNNQTDYDNEKNTLILPSASLIEKNNHVEYNPHQYVEIAGIKWATMNVGAKSITDYGLYFQWGDIQGYTADQVGKKEDGKKEFSSGWTDYKFTTDGGKTFTKYNTTDAYMELALDDDAVHAAWGGSWRMPTLGEVVTILNSPAVSATWITDYQGVAGYNFKDTNSGDELFLPVCGYAGGGNVNLVDSEGDYWLNGLSPNDDDSGAYVLNFNSHSAFYSYNSRCYGRCVRGVWDDKQTKSNQ